MPVKTKVMTFEKTTFNDATITSNINTFLKEHNITHDTLIDIKMTQIDNTMKDLVVLIIYKEY